MNNINLLKQYSIKNSEFKSSIARLNEINTKLENWDKLKASTISDMPSNFIDTKDKVGLIVSSREELQEEKVVLEIRISELNTFIVNVDSKLDCLQDNHKFILEETYKKFKRFKRIWKEYNNIFDVVEEITLRKIKTQAHREFLKI